MTKLFNLFAIMFALTIALPGCHKERADKAETMLKESNLEVKDLQEQVNAKTRHVTYLQTKVKNLNASLKTETANKSQVEVELASVQHKLVAAQTSLKTVKKELNKRLAKATTNNKKLAERNRRLWNKHRDMVKDKKEDDHLSKMLLGFYTKVKTERDQARKELKQARSPIILELPVTANK